MENEMHLWNQSTLLFDGWVWAWVFFRSFLSVEIYNSTTSVLADSKFLDRYNKVYGDEA